MYSIPDFMDSIHHFMYTYEVRHWHPLSIQNIMYTIPNTMYSILQIRYSIPHIMYTYQKNLKIHYFSLEFGIFSFGIILIQLD